MNIIDKKDIVSCMVHDCTSPIILAHTQNRFVRTKQEDIWDILYYQTTIKQEDVFLFEFYCCLHNTKTDVKIYEAKVRLNDTQTDKLPLIKHIFELDTGVCKAEDIPGMWFCPHSDNTKKMTDEKMKKYQQVVRAEILSFIKELEEKIKK